MALTLDATLATAQDSQSRRPLIEIVSSRRKDDIPFSGVALTTETFNEYGVNAIPHSSGRLCAAYCYGPDADSDCGIKYVYTDASRLQFYTVTIELFTTSDYVMVGVSLAEMTDGNICLTYLYTYNGSYYLASRILTVTGTLVAGSIKAIGNWATTTFASDPWISKIATNSYLMLYGKQSGSDYYIYKRTSADCLTWSAESALTIGGLTSTCRLDNPSLLIISTGAWWLWFDVWESGVTAPLKNIYYSVSADSGSTWGSATKFTAYDSAASIGNHPVAVQKTANQMTMAYTQIDAALHMDDTVDVWPAGDHSMELSFDTVNRKLYIVNSYRFNWSYGPLPLEGIVRVDLDTWACDKVWNTTSTPAIPAVFFNAACNRRFSVCHNDGHHLFAHANTWGAWEAAIGAYAIYLNGDDDTLVSYKMGAFAYGGNVNGIPNDSALETAGRSVLASWVDSANNKIWVVLKENAQYDIYIGYLTIGEVPDSDGAYTWTNLLNYAPGGGYLSGLQGNNCDTYLGGLLIDTSLSMLFIGSCYSSGGVSTTVLAAIDMTTGGLVWELKGGGFFGYGKPFAIVDGILYLTGHADVTNVTYRDHVLIAVDVLTGENQTLYTPTFWGATYWYYGSCDHRHLTNGTDLGDGILAMHSAPYGLALFDTVNKTWSVLDNSNTPGFTTDGLYLYPYGQIVFDSDSDLIIFGDWNDKGIVAVNKLGAIKRTYYSTGAYSGGAWTFSAIDNLVSGYYNYDMALCVEPASTSSMYGFWLNWDTDTFEYSIMWDKDGSTMDITDFLTGEVSVQHTIDGSPASLDITVSHGHLFDPYNMASALNSVLKKGNELALRFGENISGVEYWQQCGVYIVTETSISFKRRNYPTMRVRAEDLRCMWTFKHVYASEIYNNTPKEILDDILVDIGGMAVGELNIPAISSSTLQHQWMETTLLDIINQVLERFSYYFRFDYQGYAHARPITNAAAIDHTYTDSTKLIEYTPDDRYSDFTNRVTVRGQELTFTEVTYDEERITTLSGTLGWWGCKSDHTVWFSEDRSRRAINPRLEVIESSCSIPLQLAGSIEEYLEDGPTTGTYADKYCTVYTEAPNLIPNLIASLAGLIAAMFIPDGVVAAGFIANAGSTICIGSAVRTGIMIQINMILGSIANYQYAVWAQPLGEIRRSIQGQANDTDHQAEIDAIVEQVLDDPLCYSLTDCNTVAANELMVAQMQRRRVKIEKVAHLQDEDGDTIRLVHPYSGQSIDLYIASLTRKFKKATADGDGYFLDEIEGWLIP